MQENILTLPVDVLNNGVNVNQLYRRFEEGTNKTVYICEVTHTLEKRDILTLSRTLPTRTGNFRGTAKESAKFTCDQIIPGVDASTTISAPLIGECNFSIPLGTPAAAVVVLRQRMIAFLDHAAATALTSVQEI